MVYIKIMLIIDGMVYIKIKLIADMLTDIKIKYTKKGKKKQLILKKIRI